MGIRKGAEAVAWAKNLVGNPKAGRKYAGLCLMFTRNAFNVNAHFSTAAKSWAGAKKKHKTSDPMSIPAGVPVHISVPGLPPGHVAVSAGNGKIITNLSWKKTIEIVSISWYLSLKKGSKLLGWTEDLNGVTVYTAPVGSNKKPDHSTAAKKKTYVKLQSTVSRWAIYDTNKAPVAKNAKAYLNPKKFGGLEYEVLGWMDKAKTLAKIKTSQFGTVQIYVAASTGAKIVTK